jgi:hypothetical protein
LVAVTWALQFFGITHRHCNYVPVDPVHVEFCASQR